MSHHSNNACILQEILCNAKSLFNKFNPATLTKEELLFFDDEIGNIIKAALLPKNYSPEKVRAEKLKKKDHIENVNERHQEEAKKKENEEIAEELAIELRRSIKTVEVMGIVIKNRSGSLKKDELENVFEEGMNVHLRILTSFFELIKHKEQQNVLVDFIKNRLNIIVKDKSKEPSKDELETIAKKIFWNTNFFVVFGFINKIVHSLGSDKLQAIVDKVCSQNDTPATFLVKHGILMWYKKNLQTANIAERISDDSFSETTKRIMKFMIVHHCSMHRIDFKEKQKIQNELGIPTKRLLA